MIENYYWTSVYNLPVPVVYDIFRIENI